MVPCDEYTPGMIYKKREGYPKAQQPGGPGTAVTAPFQPAAASPPVENPTAPTVPFYVGLPNEKLGRFFAGCGHSFNSWEVVIDTVCGQPQQPCALTLCPLCGYIENIYSPASVLLNQEYILG